ncbi:hypothetical protein BDZ97DRAFT_1789980 [Flammula alnicola]|nr:hypothetical protein BDZ97DRAFT_1789980 [Flammula alnicola]
MLPLSVGCRSFFPPFSPVQHGKFASSASFPYGISIHMYHVFPIHLLTCPGGCRPFARRAKLTLSATDVDRVLTYSVASKILLTSLRPEPGGRGRVAPNLHSISGLPTPQVSPWPRVTRSVMPSIITKPLHRVYSLSIIPYLVRILASRTCPPNSRLHQKSAR